MTGGRTTGGRIVYAVGDVHGRQDLLELLLARIVQDARAAGAAGTAQLIFLGDYIDRGPDSRGVLDLLCALRVAGGICFLKGNHEAAMLGFLEDPLRGPLWCMHGGRETFASYGLRAPSPDAPAAEWEWAQQELSGRLPAAHREFLESLPLRIHVGDYAFVHAGLRPGRALNEQSDEDLLWIRDDFLQDTRKFSKIIVHGHTPSLEPVWDGRRIGVDTGAYLSGVLTAARIQDDEVRFLAVRNGHLEVA